MPNTDWSILTPLQLGRYAEYYAKMEFASYGFEVYTSEVDDHGVDFIAKSGKRDFWEIQVKSTRKLIYVFMQESKFDVSNPHLLLFLLIFTDGKLPDCYLIPASEWKNTNALLCHNTNEGKKSEPEYGINFSKKNLLLLEEYRIENTIGRIKEK